jgi:hypothetical protein
MTLPAVCCSVLALTCFTLSASGNFGAPTGDIVVPSCGLPNLRQVVNYHVGWEKVESVKKDVEPIKYNEWIDRPTGQHIVFGLNRIIKDKIMDYHFHRFGSLMIRLKKLS